MTYKSITIALALTLLPYNLQAFKSDDSAPHVGGGLSVLEKLEAGMVDQLDSESLKYLFMGDYVKALNSLTKRDNESFPWLKDYLTRLLPVMKKMTHFEGDGFDLFLPSDQTFLSQYALPALEKTRANHLKIFGAASQGRIRVEVYSNKEDFSHASTLSMETLKRSGAIGICKFHRLMILTPKALPLGYRWLDALSHEYTHLLVNELSWSKAELWLHEGTARYFDTAWRNNPPDYLTPNQKTKLLKAQEDEKLISFKRMSPSLVYLDNQEEVSLAFSQVSYAIGQLVQRNGRKSFQKFLMLTRKKPFGDAFQSIYKMNPEEFENEWQSWLHSEVWEKTTGAMSDDVKFESFDENKEIGANVQGKVRLGDQMRVKGRLEAAQIQYEKALEVEPDNAVILLKSARVHIALNEIEKAVLKLKKAVVSNPNYGTPKIQLAKYVDAEEGVLLLESANEINPFDPEIHLMLHNLYQKLNRQEGADREIATYELLK